MPFFTSILAFDNHIAVVTGPKIKEVKIDTSKYIRYGELKAKLFNEKGELKKVIKTDQKEQQAQLLTEFNGLKKQIEV